MRALWLLLFLAAPLGAQPLTFVNEGGPPAGLLPVAHETVSGVWLAVDEIGRVGRSTDGGATWATVDLHGVNGFADSRGELLAATTSGLWRSTDDGATWSAFALDGQNVAQAARAEDASMFALLRNAGNSALVRRISATSAWDTVRASSGWLLDVTRGQDAQVYMAVARSTSAFFLETTLHRWNGSEAQFDSLHTVAGPLQAMDATPDGRIYLATAALGLLDTPYGGLYVFKPGEGWAGYGTYASALNVQPGSVYVGGLQDVQRLTPGGLIKHATIPAPVTMLAGRTGLIASTGTVCYSAIDGTSPCDLPTSAYRIDPQTGETAPVGFGQQALYVLGKTWGIIAVGRTDIWEIPIAIPTSKRGGSDWVRLSPSPSYPELARHLAETPWGDWLLSADYWYGPGLFVGRDSTWQWPEGTPDFGRQALALNDSVILSLHAVRGLYRSADRGQTFTHIGPDDYEPGGALIAGDFGFSTCDALWGRADGIYTTPDAGLTWTRAFDTTPYGPVRAFSAAGRGDAATCMALAGRSVLRHDTDGAWRLFADLPGGATLSDDAEMYLGRYVRLDDTLYVYDEARGTFTPMPLPRGASYGGTRMTVAGDGYLYVATAEGLIRSAEPVVVVDAEESERPLVATLRAYPNPAHSTATLEGVVGSAEMFDVLGRRVALVEGEGASITLDVSGWSPGIYFAREVGGAAVPFVVAR